jgi:hypothetical protein
MISLNTLVNQLLVSYSEAGRYSKQVNAIVLSRQTFAELLNEIPEDRLIGVAKTAGKSGPESLITSKYGKLSIDGVIGYIHDLSSYANYFEYSEQNEGGHWTATLTHELGRKWSLFLANYLEQAFAQAGVKARYTISDRSTTLSI